MTNSQGFTSPNYTQAPNDWFDLYLPAMGLAEFKVSAVIIRQTLGWHKTRCELGLKRLAVLTGLSERGAMLGAEQAEQRGIIRRVNKGAGNRQRTVWELVITTSPSEVVGTVSTSLREVGLPPLVRQTTSPSEGRKTKTKETEITTTANKAAAASVWELAGLISSSKLSKTKRQEIGEADPPPDPGAFVSKYLYAVAHAGFRSPALWAASQVLDNPGQYEGQPYEGLASLGPGGLAEVFQWILSDGARPLNGSMGLALALRADLLARNKNDHARVYSQMEEAIGDLGLRNCIASLVVDEPRELDTPEPARVPAAPLDAWQVIVKQCRERKEFTGAVLDRMARCWLVKSKAGVLVVAAPTTHEFDWLQNRLGERLADHYSVTLTKAEG